MRIRNILTVTSPRVHAGLTGQRERWSDADVTIEVDKVECGPFSLEFAAEEVVAGPYILEAVMRAEREGADAVVIECMLDPVIRAARELVKIPVVGPAKAGMAFAISLGSRVAILSVVNGRTVIEDHIRAYGLGNHVCSYSAVEVPPSDLAEAKPYILDLMVRAAETAIEQDRAQVILLGCTAMSAFAPALQQALGIPVVEPASCAIRMAIDFVKLGLSQSKKDYPTPPERATARGSIDVWHASGRDMSVVGAGRPERLES